MAGLRGRRPLYATLALIAAAGQADTVVMRPIAPGVTCQAIRRPAGPWEVRVLRLSRALLAERLGTALAGGVLKGVAPLSRIVTEETRPEDYVVAATNADYFIMAGNPMAGLVEGLAVRDDELLMAARGRLAFALMADGTPKIGVFDTAGLVETAAGSLPVGGVNLAAPAGSAALYTAGYGFPVSGGCVVASAPGLALRPNGAWQADVAAVIPAGSARLAAPGEVLVTATGAAAQVLARLAPGDPVAIRLATPGLDGPVRLAVGAGAELLRDGAILPPDDPTETRHPRTAVGYSPREIVLVTVDGRQKSSTGMRLSELARLMRELGCTDAVNLDGGGSTEAWVRGEVVNSPSDGHERPIANAVLVRSRAPQGPLARLTVSPAEIVALPGARVPLHLWLTDSAFNLAKADLSLVKAEVVGGAGRAGGMTAMLAGQALTLAGPPGAAAVVHLSHPGAATACADVRVRLVGRCARAELYPRAARVCAGDDVDFEAIGLDGTGADVAAPPGGPQWHIVGRGVEAGRPGVFRAAVAGSRATVAVRIGGATATAHVRIADAVAVEGFEDGVAPRVTTFPEGSGVTARDEVIADGAAEGARLCRLVFDLGPPTGTRAAYLRLDRPLGQALRLSLQARATPGVTAWLRAAVTDASGARHLLTLADKLTADGKWRRFEARVPMAAVPPITWESVYVVATDGQESRGAIELDDLRVDSVGPDD